MHRDQPSLPAARAFVVQFHADARPEQGDFTGRVEHLRSYTVENFASAEALLAFMARILSTPPQVEDD
jgi:hypothetical protein